MAGQKPTQEWDLTQFLVSMGMSKEEAETWVKARRKGRSFKADSSDAIGEHLDRILERNNKVIYATDSLLANNILTNSYLASSMRRFL